MKIINLAVLTMLGVQAQFTEPSPAFTATAGTCNAGATEPGGNGDSCGAAYCGTNVGKAANLAMNMEWWANPQNPGVTPESCAITVAETAGTCVAITSIKQDYFQYMDQMNPCESGADPKFVPCSSPPSQVSGHHIIYMQAATSGGGAGTPPTSGSTTEVTLNCMMKWGTSPPQPRNMKVAVTYGTPTSSGGGGNGGGGGVTGGGGGGNGGDATVTPATTDDGKTPRTFDQVKDVAVTDLAEVIKQSRSVEEFFAFIWFNPMTLFVWFKFW